MWYYGDIFALSPAKAGVRDRVMVGMKCGASSSIFPNFFPACWKSGNIPWLLCGNLFSSPFFVFLYISGLLSGVRRVNSFAPLFCTTVTQDRKSIVAHHGRLQSSRGPADAQGGLQLSVVLGIVHHCHWRVSVSPLCVDNPASRVSLWSPKKDYLELVVINLCQK